MKTTARNTNAHSSRPAVKKMVRKERTYKHEVNVGEENCQVVTSCKTWGAPFLDKLNFIGDCLKCKQSKYVQDLCRIFVKPELLEEKKAKKAKTTKTKKAVSKEKGGMETKERKKRSSKIDYSAIIDMLNAGIAKKSILETISTMTSTENAAKDLYSKVSCVYGACKNPYKKDSLVYQVVREVKSNPNITLKDISGMFPEGHKGSIRYSFDIGKVYFSKI